MAQGIYVRHQVHCRSREGGRCNCRPGYQAHVYDARTGQRHRRHFRSFDEARNWRADATAALRKGPLERALPAAVTTTIDEAAAALVAGMRSGEVLDRTGRPYKPSTIRSYEQALDGYVRPELGRRRLSDVRRKDVQALVNRWRAEGLAPGTIRNKLDPLRVIYRQAIENEDMALDADPTKHLKLPANRGRRDRIETPARAAKLIAALPESDRAMWATAFYAGLRRGELRALRWRDVDFDQGVVHVRHGWDDVEGEQETKSDAGVRRVPLAGALRRELAAHKLRTGRADDGLAFGRTATAPFIPSTTRRRARTAWGWKQVSIKDPEPGGARTVWVKSREDALEPLTPHEARHCCASYLIAAGVNAKELSEYIGHSDIRTTFNLYGHLLPGGEKEAVAKLDALLDGGALVTVR